MNRINIFFGLVLAFAFWACEEETADVVLKLGDSPTITTPSAGTAYNLMEENAAESLGTFEWTPASFGFPAGITYTLELAAAGTDFAAPFIMATVEGATKTSNMTVGKLNNYMLTNDFPFGFDNPMEIRVCAEVSDDVTALCSTPVAVTVNPYQAVVNYPLLTIPGSYQGWDPANTTTAVYSRKSDDVYEGFVYIGDAGAFYKIAQGLSWDTNWGDDGNDGILDPGGADIAAPAVGMHRISVDLNTLTYTTETTNWGLIGDATPTGWDSDTDFTWDDARGVLTINIDLVAGTIKFRANDDWAINFGDNFNNGILEYEGENIPIDSDGNYTIDLLIGEADYTYSITKN